MISKRFKSPDDAESFLAWDKQCCQVESQLILPLAQEIQDRSRELASLVRILHYARQHGTRPTLTDTVAELRDPLLKRDEFRLLVRRVLDLLPTSERASAKRRAGASRRTPDVKANVPLAQPASELPFPMPPISPSRPLTDLEKVYRMMGKADVAPLAPTPQ